MAEIKEISQITSLPGIRRDGTVLDGDYFTAGQWVRFQRGRPKKIGGYREISNDLNGPIRAVLTWSRGVMNAVYSFGQSRVELLLVDNNGVGGNVVNVTPAGFPDNVDNIWSVDTMYDDAVGSEGTIVIAVATSSLSNIDDTTPRQVYFALANSSATFQPITGLEVSGGILCIAPYLVYFGSDGLVGWSDINQPQTLSGGDANSDRITGSKIVKGLSIRGGNGPAALLWSLDSVISMQYVGGEAVFRFTTVSSQSSILSQNGVVEYDGSYFWAGVDRFLMYSGGQVQELPNQNNLNWFYDGLNFDHRQKVWAMKIPRFGEIWWFYPRGDNTECSHAVIYNVREKTWYDCELARSAGYYSQVFRYPVMANSIQNQSMLRWTMTVGSGTFETGDVVATASSGITAIIFEKVTSSEYIVSNLSGLSIEEGEGVINQSRAGTASLDLSSPLYGMFIHESGTNAVVGESELAIRSFFETSDFGFPTGGPHQNQPIGLNRYTRLTRIEPDFNQAGEMQVEVLGRDFAQSEEVASSPFPFYNNTGKIDLREQRRQIRLRFTSDTLNGFYEMGRTILHTEPGDVRS